MPTKSKTKQKRTTTKKKAAAAAAPVESLRYWEGVGRRKTAVARVRLFTQSGKAHVVNERPVAGYFQAKELQETALAPFQVLNLAPTNHFVSAKVRGGGVHAQAEATRLGLARALVLMNPEFRTSLKHAGFLRRDPRMVERKKYGLKKARRAPQWAKR